MPPVGRMSGPPPGPTPQGLSSMLPQGGAGPRPPVGGPGGPGPEEPTPDAGGAPGGLKDVFDELQDTLAALASILPEYAQDLDEIGSALSEILAKAISGGAAYQGSKGGQTGPDLRPNPGLPM